ncbi:MAG: PIN domain-containing protein [Chloroflexota bacterium]|nr:PIN domain-containing protein [Chloroflexota bacterium]
MDRVDRDHDRCVELLSVTREPLIVPSPVLVELDWLATKRLGSVPFAAFLTDIASDALRVVDLMRADYIRILELTSTYADLPLGYVDASVLAVVERLREPKVATLDHRHFGVVRLRHVLSLNLLPNLF